MEKLLSYVGGFFIAIMVSIMLIGLFVYLPINMYTQAQCLAQGYPRHAITVGLERYCINLEGSVTVRVDHQGRK